MIVKHLNHCEYLSYECQCYSKNCVVTLHKRLIRFDKYNTGTVHEGRKPSENILFFNIGMFVCPFN